MNIKGPENIEFIEEFNIISERLSLEDAVILELGCGRAKMTHFIADTFPIKKIIATEVDKIQFNKNLANSSNSKIDFLFCGAQSIPLPDESIDIVMMLKSFHHVPIHLMKESLKEIHRVIKKDGLVYISEPICRGKIDELFSLFHDESLVRQEAFHALKTVVEEKLFSLVEETFFNIKLQFDNWEMFEEKVLGSTYSTYQIDETLYQTIKNTFHQFMNDEESFLFQSIRLDLLSPNK